MVFKIAASLLEAISTPLVKKENTKTQQNLQDTKSLLEDLKKKYHKLQNVLQEKETYYMSKETKLHNLYKNELHKAESSFKEVQSDMKKRISHLEEELNKKDSMLQKYIDNFNMKLSEYKKEIANYKQREQELLRRLSTQNAIEKEKFKTIDRKIQGGCGPSRQSTLVKEIHTITKKVNIFHYDNQNKQKKPNDDGSNNSTAQRIIVKQNNFSKIDSNKFELLQEEIRSLQSVLELKQNEISKLRNRNFELQKYADELPAARKRINILESRIDGLQSQLEIKIAEERELIKQNEQFQEAHKHEIKQRKRLSLQNEELQFRLKRNSEKFSLALTELSKSFEHETTDYLNTSHGHGCNQKQLDVSDLMDKSFQIGHNMKGIVEKNDSISWVFEMDDETPEGHAAKILKRASISGTKTRSRSLLEDSSNEGNFRKRSKSMNNNDDLKKQKECNNKSSFTLHKIDSVTSLREPYSRRSNIY